MKQSLLPLLLLYTALLFSQSKVDSLHIALEESSDDSLKVKLLNQISSAYLYSSADTALLYSRKALVLSEELKYLPGEAEAKRNLTMIYRLLGDYPRAIENGFAALDIYEEIGDQLHMAKTLNGLGSVYFRLEDYEESLNYYNQGLQVFEKLKDEYGQAIAYVNIGNVYKNIDQAQKSMENYSKALKINRRLGHKLRTSINLENIGTLYINQEKYDKALPYLFEALNLSREISDNQGIAASSSHIANIYQKKGKIQKSMEYAALSYEVASQNRLKIESASACLTLSKNYSSLKNFENALKFYQLHKAYRDSLYNEANLEKLQHIETSYEVQQREQELTIKEQTIALLERDKKISGLWRNILIVGLITLTLIGFLIYKFLRANSRRDKALLLAEQASTQQLEALDRAKSRFFANISHEFRTPLTLIKGPIERLEQNPNDQLSIETVKMIRRNTNRVLKLVNQLLDLSKIDESSLELDPTEGDVYKCIRAATSSFNSHAAQRNIDYRVQIPRATLWASFDRDKMEKIVFNLLSNAFKFSNDGAEISFEAEHSKQELRIQVSDSGKGIPEKALPFIFDRFFQVDNSSTKEHGGSGIGLSLSKDLVELMNGTITATSEVHKGSSFIVVIPILKIETRQREAVEFIKEDGVLPKQKSFEFDEMDQRDLPQLLLVEDNDDMRSFIKESLGVHFKVDEAQDGRVGLKKAIKDSPELIISDLMMPKMDGIELCKKLKTDVRTSHIPVIMLTAKAGMDNKIEGLEIGADDYLTKPFDARELLARTKNLLKQRQNLRDLYGRMERGIDPKKITVTSIDQKFLEQILAVLEDNYADPNFGVGEMQKSMSMSRSHLHRKIKALTNEAPSELIRNFRLKRAAQLLLQKADSVTQIAYKVGFNNLSYFAKSFKDLYGVAPSSY
ncbi:MAG: response regulator [Flavobacteriaceae bacterium]